MIHSLVESRFLENVSGTFAQIFVRIINNADSVKHIDCMAQSQLHGLPMEENIYAHVIFRPFKIVHKRECN